MGKKIISVLLCFVLVLSLAPVAAGAATTVNKVDLSLNYPEAGKTPPSTATWNGSGYSVYAIDWEDLDEHRFLEPDEKIQANHAYEAQIWVAAMDGYSFNCTDDNTPAISAVVNGSQCQVSKAFEYKAWAMVVVTCYFSYVPAKGWVKSVDLTIPAPAAGQTPFYDEIVTDSYHLGNVYFSGNTDPNMKNGISWYDTQTSQQLSPSAGEVFAPNTAYTFHCLVFPEEGYRLTEQTVVRVNGNVARARLDYDTFLAVMFDFPATAASSHQHTPSDWRITQVYHYSVCTTCGEMLQDEDHKGGEATCQEKAICSECGYAYGNLADHELITDSWTYLTDQGHAHGCQSPGCDYHGTLYPHIPGPPATVSSPQLCTECGYIMQASQNHTHSLTKVEEVAATCIKEGVKAHYTCSGCSDVFADSQGTQKITDRETLSIGALGHETGDDWAVDEAYHWRTCKTCAAILDETKMLHEDTDSNNQCDTCNYRTAQDNTEPSSTEPPATDPVNDPAPPKNNSLLLIILVGVVCFGAAITAAVIIIKKRGKK